MASARRQSLFPDASDAEWGDWRWQQRNAVRSLEALERLIPLTEDEREGCRKTAGVFRLGISPYYLSLVDPDHPFCPVRMQAIPARAEAVAHDGELRDPLGEDLHR
ncbi:MAG: lysine 2,3-aminomutase, partial [Myxococcales bacterium]